MKSPERLKHTKFDCKHRSVFHPEVPPQRPLRPDAGAPGRSFPRLGQAEGVAYRAGKLGRGSRHLLISIPPKYAVSQVVGFIRGKSAIHIARVCCGRRKNFTGANFIGPRILCLHRGGGRDGHP